MESGEGCISRESKVAPVPALRRSFSGQFNVRIDKRVYRALAIEAEHNGLTLDALVAKKLAESVD
jgi:predicted HicB family RNase H-like nuclease